MVRQSPTDGSEAQRRAADEGAPQRPGAWRRSQLVTLGLLAPLVLFIVVAFIVPIALILVRSVDNPEVRAGLPRTTAAIREWDGAGLPPESVYAALAGDLADRSLADKIPAAARRLNYETPGFRSLLGASARAIANAPVAGQDFSAALQRIDAKWSQRDYWVVLKRNARPFTDFYLLNAVDLKRNTDGDITAVAAGESIYKTALLRTFWIGLAVTLACVFLAYPLAYLISISSPTVASILVTLTLIPLWTSILVRTTAWIVLLQNHGPIVESLLRIGIISERINLVFNRTGVLIAMIHVLLPYAVLSIYSNMKNIDPRFVRAALSLGARPVVAFLTIYLPQTLPGIGAACLLTFTLAIGFYITPELVGGGGDQMISHFIARDTIETANWGQASALSLILLLSVTLIYAVYARWFGMKQLALGP